MFPISDEVKARLRCCPKNEYPFEFVVHYITLPDIPNPPIFLGGGLIFLENPFDIQRVNPGYRFDVKRNNEEHELWEIVYSEIYSGDDNNIVNGIVICWCQPVEV